MLLDSFVSLALNMRSIKAVFIFGEFEGPIEYREALALRGGEAGP